MTYLDNFIDPEIVVMSEMKALRFVSTTLGMMPGEEFCKGNMFKCGEVKKGGNEPYCYTQEKQCAGHICRRIGQGIYNVEVIRDDGTVWGIDLRNFETITPLIVIID